MFFLQARKFQIYFFLCVFLCDLRYKKITGCSSWGPGQLEKEMKNGDWLPQEKHNNIIFCNNPENNWGSMMKSIGFDTIDIISKGAQA